MARQNKRFQIFRAGSHIDATGSPFDASVLELDDMVRFYSPLVHRAALILGHQESNGEPAYGHVERLERSGDKLFAIASVDDALVDWVRDERYISVSASFYVKGQAANPVGNRSHYLRHIAFLGAQPPAVKGMEPLNFGEWSGRLMAETRNPLIADAERRAGTRTDGSQHTTSFAERPGHFVNPMVKDAERRAQEASIRMKVYP